MNTSIKIEVFIGICYPATLIKLVLSDKFIYVQIGF